MHISQLAEHYGAGVAKDIVHRARLLSNATPLSSPSPDKDSFAGSHTSQSLHRAF